MTPSGTRGYDSVQTENLRPLERRRAIRDALDQGDWKTAAQHLDHAHRTREHRMVAGIRSHRDYHETLGISRSYDYFLRLTITTGAAEAVSTFGAARKLAQTQISQTRTSPQPEG